MNKTGKLQYLFIQQLFLEVVSESTNQHRSCQLESTITLVRASTIELTQLAIRTKIIYLCLVGGERERERRREKRSGL
jgi:hypothetical protein